MKQARKTAKPRRVTRYATVSARVMHQLRKRHGNAGAAKLLGYILGVDTIHDATDFRPALRSADMVARMLHIWGAGGDDDLRDAQSLLVEYASLKERMFA